MVDLNLEIIKNSINSILPGSRELLFGSRCRGDYDERSDYDVLVITEKKLDIKEKRRYASLIRKTLAAFLIAVDVIVKTEDEVSISKNKIGSVVREALLEGVYL